VRQKKIDVIHVLYLDAEVLVLPPVFVLGTPFLLAADLRRHPTPARPYPVSSVVVSVSVPRGISG